MPVHGKDGNGLFGKRSLEFGHHAPTGHRISAQGANLGNPPGRRDPRYEGTPYHLRVSDIDPGLSYAVFLQNTLILWDAVPRARPWAGMRCPVGAIGTMVSLIRRLIDLSRRQSVETGATAPGYSGGVAACVVVSDWDLL